MSGGAGWRDPALKLHYDNLCIDTMSPWLDLALGARCLAKVLRPRRRARVARAGRRP